CILRGKQGRDNLRGSLPRVRIEVRSTDSAVQGRSRHRLIRRCARKPGERDSGRNDGSRGRRRVDGRKSRRRVCLRLLHLVRGRRKRLNRRLLSRLEELKESLVELRATGDVSR